MIAAIGRHRRRLPSLVIAGKRSYSSLAVARDRRQTLVIGRRSRDRSVFLVIVSGRFFW
ncbi:hypothetical protein ACFYPC_09390 [Streptomyces sp. NPDC005808]|uniref:hypothetical protein n=1 Tax=Streptomyces sp. NPDC005808 TaxID=3364734 RepID=UPI0036A2C367